MLSEAKTPSEYIDQLDDDWRRNKLLELRDVILKQSPQLEERIHYKMLGFGIGEEYVFHLNAQKAYVSLYVGNASKIDASGQLLHGLSVGKGCIRFKKTTEVAGTRIDEFIALAVKLWREGEDIDC